MTDKDQTPTTALFNSECLPVSVIIVWIDRGGWHPATVLYRVNNGEVLPLDPWDEPYGEVPPKPWLLAWDYLADRILTRGGGNGYHYHVQGFEVAEVSDIEPVVIALAAEVVVTSHGPYGEPVGTFVNNESDDELDVSMPFDSDPFPLDLNCRNTNEIAQRVTDTIGIAQDTLGVSAPEPLFKEANTERRSKRQSKRRSTSCSTMASSVQIRSCCSQLDAPA